MGRQTLDILSVVSEAISSVAGRTFLYLLAFALPVVICVGPINGIATIFLIILMTMSEWWVFVAYPLVIIGFVAYVKFEKSHWWLIVPVSSMSLIYFQFVKIMTK